MLSSELALQNARQDANLREQFFAVLGHDLSNPLNAINLGATQLLSTPLNGQASKTAELIRRSAARMAALIDNELSKKAMAREEYTSAMARRASNFGYDSAKPEGTVRQRGSLRAGAPSRIRSRSSPADAALDRRRHNG